MTRETRLNLIFLAIILAILTPGAVILFRKKLQPTLKPMAMPHAVQREHAYLSPLETPPGKKRVEPPHTAKWIEALVRQRVPRDANVHRPQSPDGLPLISDRKSFEVVAVEAADDTVRLWLILWQPNVVVPRELWIFRGEGSEVAEAPVKAEPAELIEVPPLVREELGELGVVRPPREIRWQVLHFRRDAMTTGRLVRDGGDFVNFVPSFTNSGATRH